MILIPDNYLDKINQLLVIHRYRYHGLQDLKKKTLGDSSGSLYKLILL